MLTYRLFTSSDVFLCYRKMKVSQHVRRCDDSNCHEKNEVFFLFIKQLFCHNSNSDPSNLELATLILIMLQS